jgi:hypothetical protein
MAEGHALSHGWGMAHPRKPGSRYVRTYSDARGLRRAGGYGIAVALVATGILGLELSAGLGWALIVFGGWFATLTSQRMTREGATEADGAGSRVRLNNRRLGGASALDRQRVRRTKARVHHAPAFPR